MSQSADSKKISIDISERTDFDPNTVYKDLEECLTRGFLISPAFVSNLSFVFKSLTHQELEYIQMLRPRNVDDVEASKHFRAAFIAHSVFLIDGVNALVDRHQTISKLIKIIRKISPALQDKIMENLKVLNEKANKCNILVESYCYEPRSRFRWLQTKDFRINDPSITGVYGTENLPINTVQMHWIALNHILDKRDDMEAAWQNAKFIGGCFAGKGIRQVEDRDRMRKDTEKQEIEDKRAEALKKYMNVGGDNNDLIEQVLLPDGRKAEVVSRFKAESAEELANMLAKALNNEKDLHDLAVERHLNKLQERSNQINSESSNMLNIVNMNEIPEAVDWSQGKQALSRMNKIREAILRQKLSGDIDKPPEE